MEYSLTISNVLTIMKRAWKSILLIMLVFALLGCGLTIISSGNESFSDEEIAANESEIENFDKWSKNKEEMSTLTFERLASSYDYVANNPLMQIDAHNCKYAEIVVAFDDHDAANRSKTVEAWLIESFGDPASGKATYLTGVTGYPGEVTVTVWDTEEYDLDEAVKSIEELIVQKAKDDKINIAAVNAVEKSGLSQDLYERQDLLQYNVVRLQNAFSSYNNTVRNAPVELSEGNPLHKAVRNGILAGFVGLLIGICYAVFREIRKGVILSSEQIREMWGLPELGTYKSEDDDKARLLSATIDAVAGDKGGFMLFNDADPTACEQLATDLNRIKEGQCHCGSGLSEDVTSAEEIVPLNGAIIPVKLSKTTAKDIQRSIRWAQRFKKDVWGYIILED